jgi:hypothetical protein
MKKNKLFLIIIVLVAFASSCKKKATPSLTPQTNHTSAHRTAYDDSIITFFSSVGIFHNEGLDTIYNKLNRFKTQRIAEVDSFGTTKLELFNLYHQYAVDYAAQKWELTPSEQNMLLTNSKNFDEDFFRNDSPSYTIYYIQRNLSITFSDTFTNLVDSIFWIGDNTMLSYPAKVMEWNNLIDNHIADLSTFREKAGLVCGVKTAISTYDYWQTPSNQAKWTSLFADAKQASKKTQIPGAWKADISGAIGGAATYGYEGFGVMGVHGAIGGAIGGAVVGALTSTSGSCITDLLYSWLSW